MGVAIAHRHTNAASAIEGGAACAACRGCLRAIAHESAMMPPMFIDPWDPEDPVHIRHLEVGGVNDADPTLCCPP